MKYIQYVGLVCAMGVSAFVQAGEKVDKQLDVKDANQVSITNVKGKVFVKGWDKSEVSVKGELDDDTERFIFEQKGNEILIKVEVPKSRNRNNWSNSDGSNLTIHIPTTIRMNFGGVSSDLTVENLSENTEANVVSGDIKATNLSKLITLQSVSGDITSKDLSGKIQLSSVSGTIKDSNSNGRLKVEAVSGDIDTESSAIEVSLQAVSGEIDYKLGSVEELNINTVSGDANGELTLATNGSVKMSSVSGDLYTEFQKGVNARFKLNSNAGGNISNRITDDKVQKAKYGPSSKLKFSTGDGSAVVKASTVSGSIKVSTF